MHLTAPDMAGQKGQKQTTQYQTLPTPRARVQLHPRTDHPGAPTHPPKELKAQRPVDLFTYSALLGLVARKRQWRTAQHLLEDLRPFGARQETRHMVRILLGSLEVTDSSAGGGRSGFQIREGVVLDSDS